MKAVPRGGAARELRRLMLATLIHRQHGLVDERMEVVELLGAEADLHEAQGEMEALAFRAPGDTGTSVTCQIFGGAG